MFVPARIEQLKTMLANEPDDLFLNYALAMEYMAQENLPLAHTQFTIVLKLNPAYIPAFYQLGKVYEAQQDVNNALNAYHQGLELAKTQKNNKAINEFNEAIFMLED